jgi:hypothetical protein
MEDHMTRITTSRFGALIAALTITLSACSDDNPVAPHFSPVNPAPVTTGLITFPSDPMIVDILVSECDQLELPSSFMPVATWYDDLGTYAIELTAGCYDLRVVLETEAGLVTQQQHGVVLSAGAIYAFEADSGA